METFKQKSEIERKAKFVPMDDMIRQAAGMLGYTLPPSMTEIQQDTAEQLVKSASQMKVAEVKVKAWADKISQAGQDKDIELLRRYRDDVVKDFTLTPEHQNSIIGQIDQIMEASMIKPKKRVFGIPEKALTETGLPGLEVLE